MRAKTLKLKRPLTSETVFSCFITTLLRDACKGLLRDACTLLRDACKGLLRDACKGLLRDACKGLLGDDCTLLRDACKGLVNVVVLGSDLRRGQAFGPGYFGCFGCLSRQEAW